MKRPSYASVAATLALFVALGGSGYAATTLPRASVGTGQLRDGAVTAAKLAPGAGAAPLAYARIVVGLGTLDSQDVCTPRQTSLRASVHANAPRLCRVATVDSALSYHVNGVVDAGQVNGREVFCVYGSFNPQAVAATQEIGLDAGVPVQVELGQAWMIQRCPQGSAGRVVAVVTLNAKYPIRLPAAVTAQAPPRTPVPGPQQPEGVFLVFF